MKYFLTILSLNLIIAFSHYGQGKLPQNQNLTSETELELLKSALYGVSEDNFMYHASANSTLDKQEISAIREDLRAFVSNITRRFDKETHTSQLLKTVFYKTHQKYLRQYKASTTFGELLTRGEYDCLTGTILYAWMLEELKFSYRVIETEHHIYLLIDSPEGEFMYESTDALNGFISQRDEIDQRLAGVTDAEMAETNSTRSEAVSLFELVGLQYYNASVEAYNNRKFAAAVDQIEKASIFYRGSRLKEFGQILARAIVASDMEQQDKNAYLMKLTTTLNKGVILASLN